MKWIIPGHIAKVSDVKQQEEFAVLYTYCCFVFCNDFQRLGKIKGRLKKVDKVVVTCTHKAKQSCGKRVERTAPLLPAIASALQVQVEADQPKLKMFQ